MEKIVAEKTITGSNAEKVQIKAKKIVALMVEEAQILITNTTNLD